MKTPADRNTWVTLTDPKMKGKLIILRLSRTSSISMRALRYLYRNINNPTIFKPCFSQRMTLNQEG